MPALIQQCFGLTHTGMYSTFMLIHLLLLHGTLITGSLVQVNKDWKTFLRFITLDVFHFEI